MRSIIAKLSRQHFCNSKPLRLKKLSLPIIDLNPLLQKNVDTKAYAEKSLEIEAACSSYGAFLIKNKKINGKSVINNIHKFFSLPQKEKDAIKIKKGGFSRGYIGIGEESGSDAFEVKEAFAFGYEWDANKKPSNSMQGPNVWPVSDRLTEEWVGNMKNFFNDVCGTSHTLSDLLSISLGKEMNFFRNFCLEGDTISLMRLFHYFPYSKIQDKSGIKDFYGSSPHTDWGFLTLILQQDEVTGLQVFHQNEWWDIEPVKDTLVVNCGDYLSLLTEGRYKSPLHRVVSDGRERTSAVLFYYPSFDAKIPRIAPQEYSLFRNQSKDQGEKIDLTTIEEASFGEYISRKWEQVYRSGKSY